MLDPTGIPKASIHRSVFQPRDIEDLKKYFELQPFADIKYKDREKTILQHKIKNNDYNIIGSIPHQIIYPKLHKIIGEHKMNHGSYAESHYPYSLHVDTDEELVKWQASGDGDKNLGILIPLSEGHLFQTVFFDYFATTFVEDTPVPENKVDVDMSIYDHVEPWQKDKVKYIPIDKIFDYKIGDLVIWDRRQLHCAVNFLPRKTFKEHIAIFV